MAEATVDFHLENLKQLINGKADLIPNNQKDQIESLYKELESLRSFLKDWEENCYEHEKMNNLLTQIQDVANMTEDSIDLLVVKATKKENKKKKKKKKKTRDPDMVEKLGFCLFFISYMVQILGFCFFIVRYMVEKLGNVFYPSLNLTHVKQEIDAIRREVKFYDKGEKRKKDIKRAKEIKYGSISGLNTGDIEEEIEPLKTENMEVYGKKSYGIGVSLQDGNSSNGDFSRANTLVAEEETIVGFDNEAMMMKEQLTGGSKQLQVISIVGMAGLGKTTLARKIYNDPLVIYHFYIRAWICVSQEYGKRDLLLCLLSSVIQHTNGIDLLSDEELAISLYKVLKGRIYFIVMDDIWDNKAWDDLRNYFPNDNNGSRIMFTSRLADMALHAKHRSPPLSLRFLTRDESWDLLRRKVFQRETCPPELIEIGKQIAGKCRGLPLAIVVVAGILANEEKTQDRWKQIGETINSSIAVDSQLCMETLALSYNHLAHHLKQCFLYFGAFPEDFEIPVQNLIWLWVAEGFVQKVDGKSLEDVAAEYLMDLVGRSLVLVSKRRSDGGIKVCGIHDLLRDFCLRKAEEGYFLKHILDHEHCSTSSTSMHVSRMRRLCIGPAILHNPSLIPSALKTRSFLCIASRDVRLPTCEFLYRCFKLLKVLDISSIKFSRFPCEIEGLVLLRYLALGSFSRYYMCLLPSWISNLINLETLLLCSSFSCVMLPQSIREMVSLRHLRLSGPRSILIERPDFDGHYSVSLENLQTLSGVDPFSWFDVFVGTPNLRKLGFRGCMVPGGCLSFPDIHFLNHLRKLKLWNTDNGLLNCSTKLGRIRFPPHLKKLTLVKTYLKWDEISTLGKLLPNLEVLKLLSEACCGKRWETSDGEFPQLKFLKLYNMHIKEWEVSSDHFPSLQRLVLIGCSLLQKIPSEVGDIPTLHMIEVHECNHPVAKSAWEIKEEQENMGNNFLQIIVSHNEYGRC